MSRQARAPGERGPRGPALRGRLTGATARVIPRTAAGPPHPSGGLEPERGHGQKPAAMPATVPSVLTNRVARSAAPPARPLREKAGRDWEQRADAAAAGIRSRRARPSRSHSVPLPWLANRARRTPTDLRHARELSSA